MQFCIHADHHSQHVLPSGHERLYRLVVSRALRNPNSTRIYSDSMPAQMQCTFPPVDLSKSIDFRFIKGKTGLVTGGASGVGNGVVRALAQNGAVVVIADINEEDGERSADKFRKGGLPYVQPWKTLPILVFQLNSIHQRLFPTGRTSATGNRSSPPSRQPFNFRRVKRSTSLSRALD